jgi:hypothetical protein
LLKQISLQWFFFPPLCTFNTHFWSHDIVLGMGTNPLTAIAEATQFPKNWDLYWTLRTRPNEFSVEEAVKMMADAQYEGWVGIDATDEVVRLAFRRMEILCMAIECSEPAPCKCPRCL